MSVLEDTLSSWTAPSSSTEQEKQERTVRMVRSAIETHSAFDDCRPSIYAKGSYPNNTNVRSDSDVDIVVQCSEAYLWDVHDGASHTPVALYPGIWTPDRLRSEVVAALGAKFPGQVDASGSTAVQVHSSSPRVEADVVPSFDYYYFLPDGSSREGTMTIRTSGERIVNYPVQHLENGRQKNQNTNSDFKKAVRILKRLENKMLEDGVHREVSSYFVECLVYNCPDAIFAQPTWTDVVKRICGHIWVNLDGSEPSNENLRWREVNGYKFLFHDAQKWTRQDGLDFVLSAWRYLGLSN
jgi:hypothetical protein